MTRETSAPMIIAVIVGIVALFVGLWFFAAWITMLLWNAIAHSAFGWIELTYWQTAGLMLLLSLLLGGLRSCCRS